MRPRKYGVDEDDEAQQKRYRKSIKNILKNLGKHYIETVKRHSHRKGYGGTLSHTTNLARTVPEKLGVTSKQINELKEKIKNIRREKKITDSIRSINRRKYC